MQLGMETLTNVVQLGRARAETQGQHLQSARVLHHSVPQSNRHNHECREIPSRIDQPLKDHSHRDQVFWYMMAIVLQ